MIWLKKNRNTIFISIKCTLIILCFPLLLSGQSLLDETVSSEYSDKPLSYALNELSKKRSVKVYFIEDWISNIKVSQEFVGLPVRDVLNELFLGTELSYIELNPNTIVLVLDPRQDLARKTIITNASREKKKIDKIVMGNQLTARSQTTLNGIVHDSKSREPLVGVSVYLVGLNKGTTTDINGKFMLTVPSGKHVVSFNYINYEEKIIDLEIYSSGDLKIELEETPVMLQEIVIEDKYAREITTTSIGQSKIDIKDIKRAPALLGEVDLVKQVQTMPGVTSVGEAASGFNVRGGSIDQNLILYDGLPIFNSSHVFGFFSSFNAEAIRDITFYRGGIPSEYGGRVSSVLDIRSREGSYEKWGVSGGIGSVSANVMLHGPIQRNKTSLAVSFRTTYSDWLINTIRSNYVSLDQSAVSFYDGTAKVAHVFNEKTKLTISGYASHDEFRLQGDSTYRWDSYVGSVRLDHEFSNVFNGSFSMGYGKYGYDVSDKDEFTGFILNYNIAYPTAKADFHLKRGVHSLNFGLQGTYYDFNPGTLKPSSDNSNKKYLQMQTQKSLESGIYLSDQLDLTKRLNADVGLRYSLFTALGSDSVLIYAPNAPLEPLNVIDTIYFSNGKVIKSYNNFEPRLGLRYSLKNESSLKFGYNRIFQYLHLVTNTTAVTPIDIWQPSGSYFKPQRVDQFSFGYFKNLKDRNYEFFAEVYYKILENVLEFKDGAQLILNKQIETDLLQGKARMYGAETQIVKLKGNFTGSLGYAYSRSLRTIKGNYDQATINGGREYASNYDQPHVINLNWKYGITKRHFFTGGFTYRTGRPITLPIYAFSVENYTVSAFSNRNQYRIPDYHRLDIGFVIEGNHKRKKILDGTWVISVYNVYGRKNPYSIFFKEVQSGILRPYQLSIIGVPLPSVSYSFKL